MTEPPDGQVPEIYFHTMILDGKSVKISYTLPNGVTNNIVWEVDAHDQEILKYLMTEYEPKIKDKVSGGAADFEPTKPSFIPDGSLD